MITKITGGRIITDKVEKDKNIYIKEGKILDITSEDINADVVIDAKGDYVSPGFIDIHTHGGGGYSFMDGSPDDVKGALKAHLKHGTTSIMPTPTTAEPKAFEKSIADIESVMKQKEEGLPEIIGAHLEGPYFSYAQRGAQNPRYITAPVKEDYERLLSDFDGVIKRWSFAPENEGAAEFCETLLNRDVVPSIGHTDAEYEQILPFYEMGCRLMTHFYSGMSGLTRRAGFRILGAIETGYLLDDMHVEIIADGKHLPPELIRLIYKCKGPEKICLVTDSIRCAGVEDLNGTIIGPHGGETIIEDGVAKMPDRQNFAGSIATYDRLVRTMNKLAGIDIVTSVKMATENPAKIMGLRGKGSIKRDYDADLVIFNDNIEISMVIINGSVKLK